MAIPKRSIRLYRCPDSLMTEHVRIAYTLFLESLPRFTAYDHSMDAAYAAAWLAELEAAEKVVRDSTVVGGIMGRTQGVGAAVDAAQAAWKDVEFFAKKAFKQSSPGTLSSFGFRELRAAGRQQSALAQALRTLHTIAVENADALINKGFSQAGIDAVDAARLALEGADSAQETAISLRVTSTEGRIRSLNAPYARMREVNAAAKRVFREDAVTRRMFRDRGRRGKKEDGAE